MSNLDFPWGFTTIKNCLSDSFSGEWGDVPNPGNAYVLRATDIDDNGYVVKTGVLRNLQPSKLTSRQLKEGDILLEGSGGGPGKPVGRVALFEFYESGENFVCSNFFKTLRVNALVVYPRFLWRKLLWIYQQPVMLALQQQTTGIINLKFREYLELPIDIPKSLLEQAKLSKVLDTLDTAIQQTEAIITKLKAVKQGLQHDLLTRGIDASGQLRPPQDEASHLYKESQLGWIPKEWDVVTLDSVSSTVTSGSRDWAQFYSDEGPLFVRIGNLTREHINFRFDSIMHVRPPQNGDGQRTKLEAGDILISITADLGVIGVVPEHFGEAYINQHVALVRPISSLINSRFVGHYLAGSVMQTYIAKLNDAGAKAGLNLPTIRNLLTAKPSLTEQIQISERLDETDMRISNAVNEVQKLTKLKSGLMDDLLTGRVRVTPLLQQEGKSCTGQ